MRSAHVRNSQPVLFPAVEWGVFHVYFLGGDGRRDGGGEGDSYVLSFGKHGKIMQVFLLAISPILRTRFYDARRRSINEKHMVSRDHKHNITSMHLPLHDSTRHNSARAPAVQKHTGASQNDKVPCAGPRSAACQLCYVRRYAARNARLMIVDAGS